MMIADARDPTGRDASAAELERGGELAHRRAELPVEDERRDVVEVRGVPIDDGRGELPIGCVRDEIRDGRHLERAPEDE
jgi:hypothetical protein